MFSIVFVFRMSCVYCIVWYGMDLMEVGVFCFVDIYFDADGVGCVVQIE
jgi:hypothetical protein